MLMWFFRIWSCGHSTVWHPSSTWKPPWQPHRPKTEFMQHTSKDVQKMTQIKEVGKRISVNKSCGKGMFNVLWLLLSLDSGNLWLHLFYCTCTYHLRCSDTNRECTVSLWFMTFPGENKDLGPSIIQMIKWFRFLPTDENNSRAAFHTII